MLGFHMCFLPVGGEKESFYNNNIMPVDMCTALHTQKAIF